MRNRYFSVFVKTDHGRVDLYRSTKERDAEAYKRQLGLPASSIEEAITSRTLKTGSLYLLR